MRFQVEKGMHWAENLLASSSVCKSLFMAICPDSIASVIRQQYLNGVLPTAECGHELLVVLAGDILS